MTGPRPHPLVARIAPYVPGEKRLPGVERPLVLASNESALGASPRALEAAAATLREAALYPDGGAVALRRALGAAHGLDPSRIVATNGSEQALHLIARAYLGPGTEVVMARYGFLVPRIAAHAVGAEIVSASGPTEAADIDALLASVTERTRVLFLDNPNNPTGTWLPAGEIRRLRTALPAHILLVLDAAYAEYVGDPGYEAGHALVTEAIAAGLDNVCVCRTFSKLYGLAALRIGWVDGGPSLVDALDRVREAFNVSMPAQAAAIAALDDRAHTDAARALNDRERPRVEAALLSLGIPTLPSGGNFLLAQFPDAVAADAHLRAHGILVRPVAGYGLTDRLRITLGRPAENDRLVAALATLPGRG